jgi:hypothetical protein
MLHVCFGPHTVTGVPAPISMGYTSQDLVQLREIVDNTKCYIYRGICMTYISTVKFN